MDKTSENKCDCTHTQACEVCAKEKGIDWNFISPKVVDKTSEEYANKLAEDYTKDMGEDFVEYAKEDFTKGYLTAIEENNVKGLKSENDFLKKKINLCLASVCGALDGLQFDNTCELIEKSLVLEQLNECLSILKALEKAKTINTTE